MKNRKAILLVKKEVDNSIEEISVILKINFESLLKQISKAVPEEEIINRKSLEWLFYSRVVNYFIYTCYSRIIDSINFSGDI